MTQAQIYTHTRVLDTPHARTASNEAIMLNRLADKAVALANEYGVVLTRKQALQRVRLNLAYVKGMAADPGVKESEWKP